MKLGRGGVGGRREMVGENARKTIKEAKRILGKGGGKLRTRSNVYVNYVQVCKVNSNKLERNSIRYLRCLVGLSQLVLQSLTVGVDFP